MVGEAIYSITWIVLYSSFSVRSLNVGTDCADARVKTGLKVGRSRGCAAAMYFREASFAW